MEKIRIYCIILPFENNWKLTNKTRWNRKERIQIRKNVKFLRTTSLSRYKYYNETFRNIIHLNFYVFYVWKKKNIINFRVIQHCNKLSWREREEREKVSGRDSSGSKRWNLRIWKFLHWIINYVSRNIVTNGERNSLGNIFIFYIWFQINIVMFSFYHHLIFFWNHDYFVIMIF